MVFASIFRKKSFWIITAMLILGGGTSWWYQSKSKNFRGLDTYQVSETDLENTLTLSGTTKPRSQVDLAFETSGKVVYLTVKEGDRVTRGQLIAQLDTRTLKNSLDSAKVSLNKYQSLYTETWETYKTETQTNIIKEKLEQARKNVEIQQLAYEAAQIALSKAYLYSPLEGTVTAVNIEVGEYATAGSAKITIADLNHLFFELEINEEDLEKLQTTSSATIELDAYPQQRYTGQVTDIKNETTENSAGETVVQAELEITGEHKLPKIGLSGKAEFILEQVNQVIAVPYEALVNVRDTDYVFVMDSGGSVTPRKVETGFENDELIEIVNGLAEGEVVILDVPQKMGEKEIGRIFN